MSTVEQRYDSQMFWQLYHLQWYVIPLIMLTEYGTTVKIFENQIYETWHKSLHKL